MKERNCYRIVILLEDYKISECVRRFESEYDLMKFAEDYLDGNSYVMEVYSMNGKKIHSYEYEVGSHNEMRLRDNV